MYHDIEELINEIEQFKTKIKDSGKLCELLAEISIQIKKYETVNNQRSETLINKHQALFESQQADLDKKYYGFLAAVSDAIEAIKEQQASFEERSGEILKVLLKEYRKANAKIIILLAGVGIAIVLGIIGMLE